MCTQNSPTAHAILTEAPIYLNADFALTARDDSMIGLKIQKGDLVYARRLQEGEVIENGTVIVLWLFNVFTLWAFYKEGDVITLKTANAYYKDLLFEDEEDGVPDIIGKAVAVLHELA